MKNKILLLEIIKDNNSLGVNKIDRLFHDVVDFSISWLPIINELRQEKLIEESDYKITKKGIDFLKTHINR